MWMVYTASVCVLLASIIAMNQENLKARLAYSTVSQLSYIVLGAALATAASVTGGALHILMHAFAKITLFFCAGAIYVAHHKTEISQLDGIGRRMPFTMLAFLIAALSIIGLPPFGGTWSKWFLALGALDSGYHLAVAVFMISSLLNIAYLLPIVARAFFKPLADIPDNQPVAIAEAPTACLIAIATTTACCIALFFFVQPAVDLLAMMEFEAASQQPVTTGGPETVSPEGSNVR
jgi:multicomponent Na+:H+ antiporter subunit D